MKKNVRGKFALLLTCGIAAISGVSLAQEMDTFYLDDIVVTATRTVVKEFDAPADIDVITREDLENNKFKDLTDALQTVPGVTITRYGAGVGYEQSEGILINGTGKILVLIDGTRANMNGSEFSVFSFGAFKALDNVERIEVLKGSASTLYGSDAKGGVINIITKQAKKKSETTLGSKFGSYNSRQFRVGHEGKSGKFSYVFGYQKDKSGNYKDANGLVIPARLDSDTFNFKLRGEFDERSDVTMTLDKYKADYMYSGTNFNLMERHYGKADNYNWRTVYNYKFNDRIKNQLSIYSQNTDTLYDGWTMDLQTVGFTEQVTTQLSDNNELVAGMDFYQEKVNRYNDIYVKYNGKKFSTKALFLQDTWDVTKNFSLTAGVRYTNHSKAGNNTSWSGTAAYNVSDKTNVYASVRQYFNAPTQYQYLSPYGNENLKPESGHTYEAGVKHKFDSSFVMEVSAFRRQSKDVIKFAYGFPVTPDNPWGGRYINEDKEKAYGWTAKLSKGFGKNFSAFAGYTHIVSKSQPKGQPERQDKYIPSGEWHIGLDYNMEKFNASLLGHGVIDRPGEGKPGHPAFPTDTYWVWDLALNYKVNKNAKVYAKFNNLFNKYYAEHSNVKWGNPDEWYASPGRNYQLGVEISF